MSTVIVVTGDYSVTPGQNISVSDPWTGGLPAPQHAGYELQAAIPGLGHMDFELDGTLTVSENHPPAGPTQTNDYVYGIDDENIGLSLTTPGSSFSAASLARVGATGILNVTMAAGGGTNYAYGYSSAYGYVPFENDGSITVSNLGFGYAYGVAMVSAFDPIDFHAVAGAGVRNTGTISVFANMGAGVGLGYGATLNNSGVISAHGGAYGVQVGISYLDTAATSTIVNSGQITATAGSLGGSIAITTAHSLSITNTSNGVITGDTAIQTSSGFTVPTIINLTNAGTINGGISISSATQVIAGSFQGAQIHNSGAIHGLVDLLDQGNDLYDGRGGTLSGALTLSDGFNLAYLGNDGETVYTGAGITAVYGGTGADTLHGGAGLDTFIVGGGNDVLDGGGGTNSLSFARATVSVTINLGVTSAQATGFGLDTISHFQVLTGSGFADHLAGTTGSDIIDGGGGNDVLNGGGGNDAVSFRSAQTGVTVSLALQGGAQTTNVGSVTMTGFLGLIGSTHDDHLTGDGNNNLIDGGGGGNDVLDGGGGINTVTFNFVTGGVNVSLALQGQAQDTGAGFDTLTHFQNLTGSLYDDVLAGDSGDNVIDGGSGNNTVSYAAATAAVDIDLWTNTAIGAGSGHDTLNNIQSVIGSAFNDYITADGFSGRYDGGGGSNTVDFRHDPYGMTIDLTAGTAADGHVTIALANIQNLIGTAQSDRIILNGGDHVITGDGGADVFVFAPTGMGANEITDFWSGDKIDLEAFSSLHVLQQAMALATQSGSNTVFNFGNGATLTIDGVTPGALSASNFVFGAPAQNDFGGDGTSDIAFRNTTTGQWGYMSVGSGGEVWHAIGLTSLDYDVVSKADFDGDGLADIAFRNHSTGDLGYMSVTASGAEVWHAVGPTSTSYVSLGAGDFNGDGVMDIAFRNASTGDYGYMSLNQGGGETWHALGPTSTSYQAIGVGDFNGDGLADMAFRNPTTGDLGFMSASLNTNPFLSAETWHPLGPTSTAYDALQPGDFDGDGKVDLPFRNPTTGDWGYMSAGPTGAEVWHAAGATSTDYAPIGTADFNSDGLADIAFRNVHTGDWGYMSANPAGGEIWRPMGPSSLDYAVL